MTSADGVTCSAYLGMSIDGFIAGPDNDLAWLDVPANPTESDYGFFAFMDSVDAIVMGRNTFDFVVGFDGDWPYTLPLLVASNSMTEVPDKAVNSEIVRGSPHDIIELAAGRGWSKLYVDGGALVTSFANEGLLDELTATILPVALGSGVPLFGGLDTYAWFDHVSTEVLNNQLVQTTYRRNHSVVE